MKSDSAANTGTALRSLLAWILVLLVVANIAVWTARPFRDQLVAAGILAPPPVDRVDLDPQALPPIVERGDPSSEAGQPFESHASGEPAGETTESVEPALSPDEDPSAFPAAPEVAGEPAVNRGPPSALLDCVIVGPVEGREALEAVAARLRSTGALVDSPEASGVPAVDYHVYVEPLASRNAARAVEQELRAQFDDDVAVILRGTYEDGVSVGVHRNRNLAEARRDRIAALGYAVKVRERHWLRPRDVSPEALGDLDHKPCPDGAG